MRKQKTILITCTAISLNDSAGEFLYTVSTPTFELDWNLIFKGRFYE